MKKNLLYITLFISVLLFINCSNKVTNNVNNNKKEIVKDDFVLGEVTTQYKDKGCDYLIKVNKNNTEKIYAAINFNDELKHEGLKFKFKFSPTKAPRKGDCKTGFFIYIIEYKIL